MEQQIKFRGLDKRDNWHYGFLWKNISGDCFIKEIISRGCNQADFEVIKESIGQLTGLKDKKENEIFDGDILKVLTLDGEEKELVVEWEITQGWVCIEDGYIEGSLYDLTRCTSGVEIIGNVSENPKPFKVNLKKLKEKIKK